VTASGFRLVLLEFNDPRYRDQIIRQVDGFPVKMAALVLDETVDSFDEFERRLSALADQCQAAHVLNLERWLADDKTRESRFKGFNYHREALAERCPFTLLLWMIAPDIKAFALKAPDLWAWRTDVLDFSSRPTPISTPVVERNVVRGSASAGERQERIAEIEAYLDRELRKDRSSALLLLELGQLYGDLGNPSAALSALERALAIFRETDDRRQAAMARGLMADIEAAMGNTDEALETYEEILKLFAGLGDVRERAVTLGKIADVLQERGQWDEALRIRQEEQLPVYERLGDVRERAMTLGKIADVLHARGEYDAALRILREDVLPTFERLGDARSRAVTLDKIADVLQVRGEHDEALRIRREEELPVFERLGDVRARATTLGKIADVLQARGQYDEVLRILREDVLPAFERLGDVRLQAVTLGKFADVLQARGEYDEALRILREEQLPVYERLQSAQDLLVCRANIGITYLKRNLAEDRQKALELLNSALQDARRLNLPEAGQIAEFIRQA
jgi:tetratricopeptide (TPR) repeat protein